MQFALDMPRRGWSTSTQVAPTLASCDIVTKKKEFCAKHTMAGMINVYDASDGIRGGKGHRGGSTCSMISTVPPAEVATRQVTTPPMVATRRFERSRSSGGGNSSSRVEAEGPAIVGGGHCRTPRG